MENQGWAFLQVQDVGCVEASQSVYTALSCSGHYEMTMPCKMQCLLNGQPGRALHAAKPDAQQNMQLHSALATVSLRHNQWHNFAAASHGELPC